jgi:hypothetical protein
MSYDVASGLSQPDPRPRPGVVAAAGMLLYGAAGLIVAQVIVSASILNRELTATREAFQNLDHGSSVISITRATSIASLVINVIFAYYNLRGRQGIRIATWVVGGLAVLCYGCGTLGSSVGTKLSTGADQDPQIKAATQHVADSLPNWATTAGTVVDGLLFICLLLVIVLLAVPASNAYFRKPEPPALSYPSFPAVS